MTFKEKEHPLDTHHLPKIETVKDTPRTGGRITTRALSDVGKYEVSDRQYVFANGTAEDFARMRAEIETRKKKEPKFLFLRCTNCRARTTIGYSPALAFSADAGEITCLVCNKTRDKKGGIMKQMTKGELAEWEKDKAAQAVKQAERDQKMREAEKVARQVDMARGPRL